MPASIEATTIPPQVISIDAFNQVGTLGPTVGVTLSQKQKSGEVRKKILLAVELGTFIFRGLKI